MRSFVNVPLPENAKRALVRLASREMRHPRDQATKMILDALSSCQELSEPAEKSTATRAEQDKAA
jgi:hypothetical protein